MILSGKEKIREVSVQLLLFLVLFLDVKLVVKIAAVVLYCCLQPDFRWGIRWKNARLPLFYPLMAGVAFLQWVFLKGWTSMDYTVVVGTGIIFWSLCFLGVHQVRLLIEKTNTDILHRTLFAFFLINALVSLVQLSCIVWETKALNPYLYQGMYQKYFISTGDYIKGLSFDTSTTNAMINAFGVVYFLARKNGWMVVVCMACLLATGSNFTNLLVLFVFGYLFVFDSDKEQKGGIVLCLLMGAVFLGKVSPQNNHYTGETFNNGMHVLTGASQGPTVVAAVGVGAADQPQPKSGDIRRPETDAERNAYARYYLDSLSTERYRSNPPAKPTTAVIPRTIPVVDINTRPYQAGSDTSAVQRRLLAFIDMHRKELPMASASEAPAEGKLPGKWLAFRQMFTFWKAHPLRIWAGDGVGNFSSKLAFRSTGLDIAGGYPTRYSYISPDFLGHDLDIYLAYFSRPKQLHSLTNSPDSVYGQLLGEYGVLGLVIFVFYYIGFFGKRLKRRGYSIPLLLLLAGSFWIGYWFEQLSIVLLFETMIFIDGKAVSKSTAL